MAEIEAVLARIEPREGQRPALTIEDQLEEQEYALIVRAQTQAGMNMAQGRRLRRLDRRMCAALDDLSELLDDSRRRLLKQSQTAWETYRENMADFAGADFEGGSMRPFIEAGVQSHLTKQRADELEAELTRVRAEIE